MDRLPPAVPVTRTIDLSTVVRGMLGKEWNEPTVEYEFSNGRVFKRQTEEAGIYTESE